MIDRRAAWRRLPNCPAPHLAAEAALDSADPARLSVTREGLIDRRHAGGRACLRAMVRVAALLS
jgi:hypothetical protein